MPQTGTFRARWVTDLLKDGPHESLSELHDHVLVSKGHFQIHLGETGLSVTSCVLHHTRTILLSMPLSVQLDSEDCDIPDKPLSWIFCTSAGWNFVMLACRRRQPGYQDVVKLLNTQVTLLLCLCSAVTSTMTVSSSSSLHCEMHASTSAEPAQVCRVDQE